MISILNTKLNLNAKLKKSNHFGVLNWNGISNSTIQLMDLPKQTKINIGDTIITSKLKEFKTCWRIIILTPIHHANAMQFLKALNLESKKSLFVFGASNNNVYLSSRNLKGSVVNFLSY